VHSFAKLNFFSRHVQDMNEVVFPDDENIKLYTSLINSHKQIWTDKEISDKSFGIAHYSLLANETKQLEGFILCRIDVKDPEVLWVDTVELNTVALFLIQEAEKIAIKTTGVRRLALFSLDENKLLEKQGFVHNRVRFIDNKAYFTPLHILNADPSGRSSLNVLWQRLLCH